MSNEATQRKDGQNDGKFDVDVWVELAIFRLDEGSLQVLVTRNSPSLPDQLQALPRKQLRTRQGLERALSSTLSSIFGPSNTALHAEQLEAYESEDCLEGRVTLKVAYLVLAAVDIPRSPSGKGWDFVSTSSLSSANIAAETREIVDRAIERIRSKFEYTPVATVFIDEPFSMGTLRRIYETVWGITLHPANFRRHVMSVPGFVKPFTQRGIQTSTSKTTALYLKGEATVLHPALLRPSADVNQDLVAPSVTRRSG